MKSSSLAALSFSSLLIGCSGISESLNQSIESENDPLAGPGFRLNTEQGFKTAQTGPGYQPGQWLEAAMPNTTFFRRYPGSSATADQILKAGTPLKVVSTKGSHVKVELENGQVGYVPIIMVAEPTLGGEQDTPFLPTPPSNFSESSSIQNATPSPLLEGGDSLIPPPASTTAPPPAPSIEEDTSPGTRRPNEIVIPTTPPEKPASRIETDSVSPESSIPPPSGEGNSINSGFGIE